MSAVRTRSAPRDGRAGFTLIELILVMGLLSGFLLLLVQTLSSGVELFRAGERSQALADEAAAAVRVLERNLDLLAGPERMPWQPAAGPDARLFVDEMSLGLREGTQRIGESQVLLATANIPLELERRMWSEVLDAEAELRAVEVGRPTSEVLAELVAARVGAGRGTMLLLPWPESEDGAVLSLRRGLFVDPTTAPAFDRPLLGEGATWNTDEILATTDVVLSGLLHFEIGLQADGAHALEDPRSTGTDADERRSPGLRVWDSARAGLFLDDGEEFSTRFPPDLGAWSEADPRDDVFPHWIRVTAVVGGAQDTGGGGVTRLASTIGADATRADVVDASDLPDPDLGPAWVKIGSEWVRVGSRGVRSIGRLERGRRGTRAVEHQRGEFVRVGREVTLYVRLPHGRDG
jgi:hypothetical protein